MPPTQPNVGQSQAGTAGVPSPAAQAPAGQTAASAQSQAPPTAASAPPAGTGEHVVREGECIASIALRSGHFWETIWNHSRNADLKTARGDPNVLLPNDRVHVPPLNPKQEPGATEQLHRFQRRGEPGSIHILLKYKDGRPIANEVYEMIIESDIFEGTTDADGGIHQRVRSTARRGWIRVRGLGLAWPLRLGCVDPLESLSGVQARLANLGYPVGRITGQVDENTTGAIRAFQRDNNLEPTGVLTEETRQKIREKHGS